MEKRTMGALMSALRKSKGMTQQDVAEKLGVSNKSVSKWECDDGYPDISMLPAIAEIYGVTVDELLKGEIRNEEKEEKACSTEKGKKQIEMMLKNAFVKFKNMSVIAIVLTALSLVLGFLLKNILEDYLFNTSASLTALCTTLVLAVTGLLIQWFAGNKLVLSLTGEDAVICEDSVISYLKSARNCIAVAIGFSLAGIFGNIADYIAVYYNEIEFTYTVLGLVISQILTIFLFFIIGNKLLGNVNNEEIKRKAEYGKKTAIGIIAGTLCTAVVLSTVIGIVYKTSKSRSYTFKNKENYNDFMAVVGENKIPLISKDEEKLTVTVAEKKFFYYGYGFQEITYGMEEPEGLIDTWFDEIPFNFGDGEDYLDVLEHTFDSKESMNKFIEDYCVSAEFLKGIPSEFVRCAGRVNYFSDDLTVRYDLISNFNDIFPMCALFVAIACVLFAVIYIIVRKRKYSGYKNSTRVQTK